MKNKQVLLIISGAIVIIGGCFVYNFCFWYFTDDSYYSFMGTYISFQNTSVQKYLIENKPNESVSLELIKAREIGQYLLKIGYLEACSNISQGDFSIFYDNNSIIMINAKSFKVECDYVSGELK